MTVPPSSSLHVLTPKLADIKPSSSYPPTPLTPHSNFSAMSSRVDLPPVPEHTKPPEGSELEPISVSAEGSTIDISSAHLMPEQDRGHEGTAPSRDQDVSLVADQGEEVAEGGSSSAGRLGLQCAPPHILPPSPPLTDSDPRDEAEAGTSASAMAGSLTQHQKQENVTEALPNMREEDITNWRASMGREGKREEENADGEEGGFEGEYDPYDLGYSPVTPSAPGPPNPIGDVQTKSVVQHAIDHPLRFDVHPPSPPPWEVISPPGTSENVGTNANNGPYGRPINGPKPSTSRPVIPHSAYYFGPPPLDAAYHTDPIGQLGVHHPREIVRVERDYTGGELVQFAPTYPLELEGRITPTQFLETINAINECLISAHSLRHSFIDNALSFFTLQFSRLVLTTHYDKEMRKLQQLIEEINRTLYNPVGLNILWPRKVAFMFLEIEYY